MQKYRYIFVATGELEAPDENHARLQVEMGISMTQRMLRTPHQVSIEVAKLVPEIETNGHNRIPLRLIRQPPATYGQEKPDG